MPVPLTLLMMCLLLPSCRKHLDTHDYDVVICDATETDFAHAAIRDVHF